MSATWKWVLVMAVVGNCLTWFSMFLLIEFGELVLAAAAIAATPITTQLATRTKLSTNQELGGCLVLLSLAVLIWLELARPKGAPTNQVARGG